MNERQLITCTSNYCLYIVLFFFVRYINSTRDILSLLVSSLSRIVFLLQGKTMVCALSQYVLDLLGMDLVGKARDHRDVAAIISRKANALREPQAISELWHRLAINPEGGAPIALEDVVDGYVHKQCIPWGKAVDWSKLMR
jgi:hypothetical protein